MIEAVCRTCGGQESLKDLVDCSGDVYEKLLLCACISVNVTDRLPKSICAECEEDLDFCYQFRVRAIETEHKLRLLLERLDGNEGLAEAGEAKSNQDEGSLQETSGGNDADNMGEENERTIFYKSEVENEVLEVNSSSSYDGFSGNGPTKSETPEDIMDNQEDYDRKDFIYDSNFTNLGDNLETLEDGNDIKSEEESKEKIIQHEWNNGENIHINEENNDDLVEILSSDEEDSGNKENMSREEDYDADVFFLDDEEELENDGDVELVEGNDEANEEESSSRKRKLDSTSQDETDSRSESKVIVSNYTCNTCSQEFLNQAEYREHIKLHGKRRFPCSDCDKWFSTPCHLKLHKATHSSPSDRVTCKICQKSYSNKKTLGQHIRSIHRACHRCSVCELNCESKTALKTHMLEHEKEKEKDKEDVLRCPQCLKYFKTKSGLRTHIKLHEAKGKVKGTKSYYCVHCGKVSLNYLDHKNHYDSHFKDLRFKCDNCSRAFGTMAALITHEYTHSDNRPYQCEHCLLTFRQAVHLKEHKKIHATKLPFICKICGAGFNKKYCYDVHMQDHEGEAPRKCPHCDETFSLDSLLAKHCLEAHRISVNENQPNSSDIRIVGDENEAGSSFEESKVLISDIVDVKITTYDSDNNTDPN